MNYLGKRSICLRYAILLKEVAVARADNAKLEDIIGNYLLFKLNYYLHPDNMFSLMVYLFL